MCDIFFLYFFVCYFQTVYFQTREREGGGEGGLLYRPLLTVDSCLVTARVRRSKER